MMTQACGPCVATLWLALLGSRHSSGTYMVTVFSLSHVLACPGVDYSGANVRALNPKVLTLRGGADSWTDSSFGSDPIAQQIMQELDDTDSQEIIRPQCCWSGPTSHNANQSSDKPVPLVPVTEDRSVLKHVMIRSSSERRRFGARPMLGATVFFHFRIYVDDAVVDDSRVGHSSKLPAVRLRIGCSHHDYDATNRTRQFDIWELALMSMECEETSMFLARGSRRHLELFGRNFTSSEEWLPTDGAARFEIELLACGEVDLRGDGGALFSFHDKGRGSRTPSSIDEVKLSLRGVVEGREIFSGGEEGVWVQLGVGELPLGVELAVSQLLQLGGSGELWLCSAPYAKPVAMEERPSALVGLLEGQFSVLRGSESVGAMPSRVEKQRQKFRVDWDALALVGSEKARARLEVTLLDWNEFHNCSVADVSGNLDLCQTYAQALVRNLGQANSDDWVRPQDGDELVFTVHSAISQSQFGGPPPPLAPGMCTLTVGDGSLPTGLELAFCRLHAPGIAVVTLWGEGTRIFGQNSGTTAHGTVTLRVQLGVITHKFYQRSPQELCLAAQVRKLHGNELWRQKRDQEALSKYQNALTLMSLLPGEHGLMKEERSDTTTVDARGLEEQRAELECNSAACLLRLGEWEKAEKCCTIVLEICPNSTKALYRRSKAYTARGNLEEAEADLSRACQLCSQPIAKIRDELSTVRRLRRTADQTSEPFYRRMLFGAQRDP